MGVVVYAGGMALTLKNTETVELARELAARVGTNQTAAITWALRQGLAVLETSDDPRPQQVNRLLTQIWEKNSSVKSAVIDRRMADLYDGLGLPA